jgi:hypothetical protein
MKKATRYSTSRQKACLNCVTAKAKCDRKAGRCTRCALRDSFCTYPQALPSLSPVHGAGDSCQAGVDRGLSTSNTLSASEPQHPRPEPVPARVDPRNPIIESLLATDSHSPTSSSLTTFTRGYIPKESSSIVESLSSERAETLNFPSQELFCPINVDDIKNRWLNSYVPVPGQVTKKYPPSVAAFIYRILKSYAAVTVRGRGVPPFVHAAQLTTNSTKPPLSTCLTLVRISEKPLPGSEIVVADVLQREMNSIYEQHGTYNDMTLLSAFQAYLIYSMVLFFKLGEVTNPFLRQAMMNLQDLACSSSRHGLMCIAEQQRARPRWEAWIFAEANRRTMFTMYLFDSVLSAHDGLPTFLGTELQGLPAPSSQRLWRAFTQHEWEVAYNIYLADWTGGIFQIDELWPIPENLDELGLHERRSRVDQWLEGVDEFGTMIYAVTSCTHGG